MMLQRYCPMLGVSLVVLATAAGCQQGGTKGGQESFVQIGTTKADLFGLPAEYRALHPRLEECLGRQVRFRPEPDGRAVGKQLSQGAIAYAILTAAEYASVEEPGRLTLLASGINPLGKTSRRAYLVVKAGSHVKTVSDCRGKRFAFGAYGDLLTDVATRRALEEAGVPVKELLPELLLPPPLSFEGRLYLRDDTAKTIVNDLTVNAGVIDEVVYEQLPPTGGNFIVGPSRDQLKIVGQTMPVPELLVVAGPAAEAEPTAKLKQYLLDRVKEDQLICRQLGVKGFAEPDAAAYEAARKLLKPA